MFNIICVGAYMLMETRLQKSHARALCKMVEEYMTQDEKFENEYGKVISVEPDYSEKTQTVDKNIVRIICIVKTEGGNSYSVLVECDFTNDNDPHYKYLSVSKQ